MYQNNSWARVPLSLIADGKALPYPSFGSGGCGCGSRGGHGIVMRCDRLLFIVTILYNLLEQRAAESTVPNPDYKLRDSSV